MIQDTFHAETARSSPRLWCATKNVPADASANAHLPLCCSDRDDTDDVDTGAATASSQLVMGAADPGWDRVAILKPSDERFRKGETQYMVSRLLHLHFCLFLSVPLSGSGKDYFFVPKCSAAERTNAGNR